MKSKRSVLALLSLILTVLYLIYLIKYFYGANTSNVTDEAAIGAGLATALVFPHMLVTFIAALCNALGYFMRMRGFILAAAILYAVAMFLMPLYFFFVIIQMIFCFIAFARMKKQAY